MWWELLSGDVIFKYREEEEEEEGNMKRVEWPLNFDVFFIDLLGLFVFGFRCQLEHIICFVHTGFDSGCLFYFLFFFCFFLYYILIYLFYSVYFTVSLLYCVGLVFFLFFLFLFHYFVLFYLLFNVRNITHIYYYITHT